MDINQLIGKGACGKVYKVKFGSNVFACKVQKVETVGKMQKVLHEVELLHSISHPNIMRILSFGIERNHSFTHTEMFDEDLFNYLHQRKFIAENDLKVICIQILKATEYLHNHEILHRDVKLENILIMKESLRVQLIDFGTARKLHDSSRATTHVGSRFTIAPEICLPPPFELSYSFEVDMFSFGVTLYMLLTNINPFIDRKPLKDDYSYLIETDIKYGEDVFRKRDNSWIVLTRKLMSVIPLKRPTAAEALNSECFS
eukprot:snap_masked-scaffold_7-processed-gene-2.53-mRNA-1 protein AED:0.30 eAED:0.30 QI:0/-1/0/1/-1/1/1/0/257